MEKYDIIIQAGQSNAQGFGRGEAEHTYIPCAQVHRLSVKKETKTINGAVTVTYPPAPFTLSIAEEERDGEGVRGNFALAFAQRYIQNGCLTEGRKLLIIQAAVGGTGFVCGHWGMDAPLYLKMLEMTDHALRMGRENRLTAFLWHQGESDANRGISPRTYGCHIRQMVIAVRERYGTPELPFIAGDFVPQWRNLNAERTYPVIRELRECCRQLPFAAFVESDGLLSNAQKNGGDDILHFCRQSQNELGCRYFHAYRSIKGGDL